MKVLLMRFTLLLGCGNPQELPTYPIEQVRCEHPSSQYEAIVTVSVTIDESYTDIIFTISQGDLEWQALMWELDEANTTWDTSMHLYELDCSAPYEYEFSYIQ
jgi:hypothetical protein